MKNECQLITEYELKQKSPIGGNVDADYIAPALMNVQTIYLQQLIGTNLLQKLYNIVNDNTIDDENNNWYAELLDEYIQPYLVAMTTSEMCVTMYSKIRNAGVVQYADTNQSNLDFKGVSFMREHYMNQATFLSERMCKYLSENKVHFPEYKVKRDCSDIKGGYNNKFLCAIKL